MGRNPVQRELDILVILSELTRQQEWEAFTREFQQPLPEARAGQKWMLMERIFKLE